ncbi:MAG: class I SAM-dependent methyltransferase [Bacteroidales bacterium]|nr:class I SAM-dependent methyltransferase [Bacteroidales bacterium]
MEGPPPETGDCCAYLVRAAHKFYFTRIMPLIGAGISKDKAAYRYLPASVLNFPKPQDCTATMQKAGFADVRHRPLSLGICNLFTGMRAFPTASSPSSPAAGS